MPYLRWVQVIGVAAMVASMISARVPALRPHGRRIGLAIMVIYICAAAAFVGWRMVVGPEG